MFKKKMKQIGAMAMAASMILASVQLPPLAANAAEKYKPGIECNGNSVQL